MSIDEGAIWDKINVAETRMTLPQRRLWEVVRIVPEWRPMRDPGISVDGCWVVAIVGATAIWYNDIEYGFCRSRFSTSGEITEFKWNDYELGKAIQNVLNEILTGECTEVRVSGPIPGEHPLDR